MPPGDTQINRDVTPIKIEGLAKFRRDLRAMGSEYRKGLDRNLKATVQPIVQKAKAQYRIEHPRRRGGRGSQRGIRGTATGGKVRVILGGTRYPYLLGQEFGSNKYPQFPAWTNQKGTFFWPEIRKGTGKLIEDIEKVLDDANKKHFEG